MKKIVLASVLVISILFAGIYASNIEAATAQKPLKGQIVSLDDIIKGVKDLQLTKERATELLERGSPLVFLYNNKIYFVQEEDGAFAFRRLANFAHNKNVGIVGKTRTVRGINVLVMSSIDSIN